MRFTRRSFIKSISAAGAAFTWACSTEKPIQRNSSTGDALYDRFANPLPEAKPFYRWWWNDNRLTEKEIRREIQLMAKAGAGGVEINPIALPEVYENLAPKSITWLSKEWKKMLLVAVEECHKQNMVVDLIVGTGWPFGGEFLQDEECIQGLESKVMNLQGAQSLEIDLDIPKTRDHRLVQVVLFPESVGSLQDGVDFTDKVSPDYRVNIDVPQGKYQLHIVTWRNKFREVMFGAPGGAGPVLDHFNKKAVRRYLHRTSSALNPVFGGALGHAVRSIFCDSIELSGANWTTDFSAKFKAANDYDLTPWLPLLLNQDTRVEKDFQEKLKRVRYDYSKMMADLFMDNFIIPFHQWCNTNGCKSRYQAYGFPWLYTDLLDGYLVPDIPESDQWLFNGGWTGRMPIDDIRYNVWNKYTSSAGFITGKRVISCEAMTNTRGVWEASLEYIKQATDINTITGINHLVLHGWNYSPENAPFPGWIRFGTFFSERNTWFPYLHKWSDYAARLAQIMQDSRPITQIAILGNTADKWQEGGLERNHWIDDPIYLHEIWQALNHHGFCADYINETVLKNAKYERGHLHIGAVRYRMIIVADVESLEPDAAAGLLQFAEQGGKILFVNEKPNRAPGFAKAEENDLVVSETMRTLFKENSANIRYAKYKEKDDLTEWIAGQMRHFDVSPIIRFSHPDEKLYFIAKWSKERQIYFLCNMHRDRELNFNVTFPETAGYPWLWDAETGNREPLHFSHESNQLDFTLQPLQSKLIVFQPDNGAGAHRQIKMDDKIFTIPGPWEVNFVPVEERAFNKTLARLIDFSKDKNLRDFAGTAIYKTRFLFDDAREVLLDLGKVYDIAEVELNGKPLGVKWWGNKQFYIHDELQKGMNELTIKVTTSLFNYCYSLKDENPQIKYWIDRRPENKDLLPAGLVGPVKLLKMKN